MAEARDLALIVGNVIRLNGYQIPNFDERVDQSVLIIEQERGDYAEPDEEMASLIGDNLIMQVWCTHLAAVDDIPDQEHDPLVHEFHTLRDVVIEAVCEFYGIEDPEGEEGEEGEEEQQEEEGGYEDNEDGDGKDA